MSTVAAKTPEQTEPEEQQRQGGRTKRLVIIAVALLLVGGAAYWFLLKPEGPEPAPEPGEILPMDSTQINLADGHYLRLGIALQLTATAHEADGSKALDAAIEIFSGKSLEQLEGHKRAALKEKLTKELEHRYHGDVMDVYFTEFVTQ